jgi:hypothetical protein
MKPFTSLDEVLNAGALTPATSREVAPAKPAGDFQPFSAAGALASHRDDAASHDAPQIELVQEDGRIQQIVVTCRCGERTVLDCAY